MNRLIITVSLVLTLAACGGSVNYSPGTVTDTSRRSVTVKLDTGETQTYYTSKNVARRCARWFSDQPARWPDCRSAF